MRGRAVRLYLGSVVCAHAQLLSDNRLQCLFTIHRSYGATNQGEKDPLIDQINAAHQQVEKVRFVAYKLKLMH